MSEEQLVGVDPRTGEALPPIACTPASELDLLVARAREAGEVHARRPIAERALLIREAAEAILEDGERLAELITLETGKPAAEAWLHEVAPTAELGRHWANEGPELLAPHAVRLDPLSYPKKRAAIERVPRGVIALITPWNFPLALPLRTLFPALLAGNAVVLKPSEATPRVAHRLGCVLREVFGPHLVPVAVGEGALGAALIGAQVDAVCFIGSVRTGKKVGAAAGEALVPVSLELGGKDAAIVCADADLERCVPGVLWGALANCGQNCAGIERIFVERAIAERFTDALVAAAEALEPERDYGPLTTAAQLAIVEDHMADARAAEAVVRCGGACLDRSGHWFPPTVLQDVPASAKVITEESFGPLLPVTVVDDAEQAIARANDSRYGLTGSVWTRDLAKGERIAKRLRAGVVTVNNHGFTGAIPALPWGGVGATGFGVTNSAFALDVLTRPRALVVDAQKGAEPWWLPYGDKTEKLGRALAAFGRARGLKKLPAAVRLLRAL